MKLWTNSRRSAFQRCKKEHHLSYIEGWRKVKEEEDSPLFYGTEWHDAVEVFWSGGTLEEMQDRIQGRFENPINGILIRLCLEGYYKKWIELRSKFRVVAIEKTFVTPMINPITGRTSRTWKNGGKYDTIVEALESFDHPIRIVKGNFYNLEHKSTSYNIEDPLDAYYSRLLMDNQVSHYHVAGAFEYSITGTIYDIAKKLSGNLKPSKKKGIKQKKNESDEEWAIREKENTETIEEFTERVRAKVVPEMFQWRMVSRTKRDIEEYQKDTWFTAMAAHEAEQNEFSPKNPDACMMFGKPCRFFDHCSTGQDLGRYGKFVQSDWVHPELPDLEGKELT